MRTRRHAPPSTRVSLQEISTAIGKKPRATLELMQRTGLYGRFVRFAPGQIAYDQRVIDLLHAVLGQPHRPLDPGEADWLSQYTSGGDADARTGREERRTGP